VVALLFGVLAFVVGIDLIVFSPVPVARECRFRPLIAALDGAPPGLFGYHPRWERYYYRTWPPGVVVAAVGVASIGVGVYLRRRRSGHAVADAYRDRPEHAKALRQLDELHDVAYRTLDALASPLAVDADDGPPARGSRPRLAAPRRARRDTRADSPRALREGPALIRVSAHAPMPDEEDIL